jgi:hypothetical protein
MAHAKAAETAAILNADAEDTWVYKAVKQGKYSCIEIYYAGHLIGFI